LTKVLANGNVAPPPKNSYVTDKVISISLTPSIETGNTFSVRSGCGCSVARFKANDTFNWFEFNLVTAALEPELEAFLLGANTITDGPDVVGLAFPGALDCGADEPTVALEFWTQHVVGSGQDGQFPWVHWVFPKTIWQRADNTFEEDAARPSYTGFSRTNSLWGAGPYGDGPPDGEPIREGGWWKTDVAPPTAVCAAVDVTPGS
jgi:hypothetical protein